MAFYIDTIEQTKGEEDGTYKEYGKREKWDLPFNQVESKYFKKLSDVSNDIITEENPDNNHYFMDIRIVDSLGGVLEKKSLGKYQEV